MTVYYHPLLRDIPMPEPIVAGLPNEEEFACPGDGLFPDPNSGCKAYFNCQGSQSWRFTCPPSLKFDATDNICRDGKDVSDNCNAGRTGPFIPQPQPIVAGLPNEDDFDCTSDGLFPDPNSACRAYFNCQGDQSWRFTCPPTLKFDATDGVCKSGEDVDDNCNSP